MRISDWSSDVSSSDLPHPAGQGRVRRRGAAAHEPAGRGRRRLSRPYRLRSRKPQRTRRAQRRVGPADRKSAVSGKSMSARVEFGGCRIIKKKKPNIVYVDVSYCYLRVDTSKPL